MVPIQNYRTNDLCKLHLDIALLWLIDGSRFPECWSGIHLADPDPWPFEPGSTFLITQHTLFSAWEQELKDKWNPAFRERCCFVPINKVQENFTVCLWLMDLHWSEFKTRFFLCENVFGEKENWANIPNRAKTSQLQTWQRPIFWWIFATICQMLGFECTWRFDGCGLALIYIYAGCCTCDKNTKYKF